MITLRSRGGLGNQLFNYAAARSLADRNKTDLVIDAIQYRNHWNIGATRPFVLHRFPVRATFRNLGSVNLKPWIGNRLVRRFKEDLFATRIQRPPDQINFFENFTSLGSRCNLDGHFIDPRFFINNAEKIKEDLDLSSIKFQLYNRRQLTILKKIRERNSVSIHVRRGDLLEPAFNWLLLPKIEQYYQKSIKLISAQLKDPIFFIFSDDPEWCREAFHGTCHPMIFVSTERNSDPMQDFYMMTQCTHHIIANSAFSWWSAWLAKGADKVVLAPSRWDTRGLIEMTHMLPENWNRIDW